MKFRNLIFLFIALTIYNLNLASAQNFNGGFLGGIVASQVDGDTYGGYNKVGFNVGVFVNYQLSYRTGLQVELNFLQKGSRHNPDYENNDYSQYILRLNYMEVPLLLSYKIYENFAIEIGPSLGYLVSNYEERDYREIESNPFRKYTANWITGFHFLMNKNWSVNFRFDYSLIGIRNKPAPGDRYILFQYGQFNNVLNLSLQYTFNHSNEKP